MDYFTDLLLIYSFIVGYNIGNILSVGCYVYNQSNPFYLYCGVLVSEKLGFEKLLAVRFKSEPRTPVTTLILQYTPIGRTPNRAYQKKGTLGSIFLVRGLLHSRERRSRITKGTRNIPPRPHSTRLHEPYGPWRQVGGGRLASCCWMTQYKVPARYVNRTTFLEFNVSSVGTAEMLSYQWRRRDIGHWRWRMEGGLFTTRPGPCSG